MMDEYHQQDIVRLHDIWREFSGPPRYTISDLKSWMCDNAGIRVELAGLYDNFNSNNYDIVLSGIAFTVEIKDDNKFIHAKLKYL